MPTVLFWVAREKNIETKQRGRSTPDLMGLGEKRQKRIHSSLEYDRLRTTRMTVKRVGFCFLRLRFGGYVCWTKKMVTRLEHLSEQIKKRQNSLNIYKIKH